MEKTIYQENGYKDRKDYFEDLSRSYGVPMFTVLLIAEMLGAGEDFDALPLTLDDYSSAFTTCFND